MKKKPQNIMSPKNLSRTLEASTYYYMIAISMSMAYITKQFSSWLLGYGDMYSYNTECILLLILQTISFVFSLLELKKCDLQLGILVIDVFFPFSLFFILDFWPNWELPQKIIIFFLLGLTLSGTALINLRCIHSRKKSIRRRVKRNRILLSARLIGIITIICAGILLINYKAATPNYEINVKVNSSKSKESTVDVDYTIFREDIWEVLSITEKMNALSKIIEAENIENGIPEDFVVKIRPELIDDATLLGYYSDYTSYGEIVINLNHLTTSSAKDIIKTIVHECTHCYQYRLCESWSEISYKYRNLREYNNIAILKKEFELYISGTETSSYYDYFSQKCEEEARNRAEERFLYYYSRLIYGKAKS